jgi:hypothetical protein
MKRLLALQTGLACAGALGCTLLAVLSGAALAQTTGAVNPKPASAEPAVKQEPSSGDCMPIGLTVSGEIVFPFQCKDFIERQKAAAKQNPAVVQGEKPDAAENSKPAAAEQKPDAAEENTVAKQPAAVEKPAIAEVKPAAGEEKPAPAEKEPAVAEEKAAAAEENTAAKHQDGVVPESRRPAAEPVEATPLQKRVENEPRKPTVGPPGCMHFRSYQPASGTYRSFDGRRLACR